MKTYDVAVATNLRARKAIVLSVYHLPSGGGEPSAFACTYSTCTDNLLAVGWVLVAPHTAFENIVTWLRIVSSRSMHTRVSYSNERGHDLYEGVQ